MTVSPWSAFGHVPKAAALILRKPSTFLIHCAECSLVAHGTANIIGYLILQMNVSHPSRLCAHEQCFPQLLLLWVVHTCRDLRGTPWPAHLFTVAYEGAVSPYVATISALLSFGANLFLWRYLIIPQCQILSIFLKSAGTTF